MTRNAYDLNSAQVRVDFALGERERERERRNDHRFIEDAS